MTPQCNCPYCVALLLPSEAKGKTAFSKCCAKGRVQMRQLFDALQNMPLEFTNLLYSTDPPTIEFRKKLFSKILEYNDHLSFGHVKICRSGSQDDRFPQERHIVKINNMIQYLLWNFNAPPGRDPMKGQLFTIPPVQAKQRIGQISQQLRFDVTIIYNIKMEIKLRKLYDNIYMIFYANIIRLLKCIKLLPKLTMI